MNDEHTKIVRNMLDPSEAAKARIYNKIHLRHKQRKPMIISKGIAIAAIVVVLTFTMTMAVAHSSVLREIIFGDSRAAQVEAVDESHNRFAVSVGHITIDSEGQVDGEWSDVAYSDPMRISVYTGDGVELLLDTEYFSSYTNIVIDEWNDRYAPFDIRKPSYPLWGELLSVALLHGEHGDAVSLQYNFLNWDDSAIEIVIDEASGVAIGRNQPRNSSWSLFQYSLGHGGYFNFETTYPIEKVMIGDSEALLVEFNLYLDSTGQRTYRILIWVADGYFYILSHADSQWDRDFFNLDTLIKIAKSIG